IYIVSGDIERHAGFADTLTIAGYNVSKFKDAAAAYSEFLSNPPHMVLFFYDEKAFDLRAAMHQTASQLPESHIFLAASASESDSAALEFEEFVYDFIYLP